MPSRARRNGVKPVSSVEPNRIVPAMLSTRPMRVFIKVDLPTPLRPMTATISPLETLRSMPCSTGLPP